MKKENAVVFELPLGFTDPDIQQLWSASEGSEELGLLDHCGSRRRTAPDTAGCGRRQQQRQSSCLQHYSSPRATYQGG